MLLWVSFLACGEKDTAENDTIVESDTAIEEVEVEENRYRNRHRRHRY